MKLESVFAVTDEHSEAYARDGIVLVRGAFEKKWIDQLLEGFHALREMPEERICELPASFLESDPQLMREVESIKSYSASEQRHYTQQSTGFFRYKYMYWWVPEFRDFIHHSPAAAIIAKVIESTTLRYFVDAIFMKQAGCDTKTYWHSDEPAWPVSGQQVPTMWMPLLPVDAKLSSLEYIQGSHRQRPSTMPWPNTFNAKMIGQPDDRPGFYDWEERRSDGETRFVAYDMEPGDIVILHPNLQHGGGANMHPTQPRIAYSTRWFGDDVRWDPRLECINTPGKPLHKMVKGQPVREDDAFPLLFSSVSRSDAVTGLLRGELPN